MFLVSHLCSYFTLGKCWNLNVLNLAHWWFFQCYNTKILNAKLSSYYLTHLVFNVKIECMVCKRTVTRFIAVDKVVYQQVRWEMRLASDNSWARRRLKHVSWRSLWIILCTLEQRTAVHVKSQELIVAFLAFPPDWAQGPPLLRDEHSLLPPGYDYDYYDDYDYWTVVPIWWILFSRLSMLPSFEPLLRNSFNNSKISICQSSMVHECTILLWQIEIFNENCIFVWNFHDFV